MTPTTSDQLPPWTPLNEPGAAFAAGILALAAALAAALASRMAAPLFAAMLAVGLGANAGLLAAHESGRTRWTLTRTLGWGLAGASWIAYAVALLHTPLAYPDSLRAVAAALVTLAVLMRIVDRLADDPSTPGLAVSLFFDVAALAVLWLGGSAGLRAGLLQTIAIAVSLELCAVASAWLAVAWFEHKRRHNSLIERARGRAAARYSVLRHI